MDHTLTRFNYDEGESIMTTVSSDHDRIDEPFIHAIFRFFTTREARKLRLVCREFRDNVTVTQWNDLTSMVGRSRYTPSERVKPIHTYLHLWRTCFPMAIGAKVSANCNEVLQDEDFLLLRGLHTLDMSGCGSNADVGFRHLQGIHTLNMSNCYGNTDAAFRHLKRIHTLNVSQCKTITDAAFIHLEGIHTLNISGCPSITDATIHHLQGIHTLIVGSYGPQLGAAALPHLHGIKTLVLRYSVEHITPADFEQLDGITHLEVPRLMHPLIAPMVPNPANGDAVMGMIEEGNPIWIHALDHLGSSPIHWASKRGLEPVVRSLLQRGADPTVTNSQNDTPLHWALQRGHVNIARLLLEHGADLHAENYSHKTPLDYAIVQNRTEFIPELVLFISDFS
jgi:hypothetical protein